MNGKENSSYLCIEIVRCKLFYQEIENLYLEPKFIHVERIFSYDSIFKTFHFPFEHN